MAILVHRPGTLTKPVRPSALRLSNPHGPQSSACASRLRQMAKPTPAGRQAKLHSAREAKSLRVALRPPSFSFQSAASLLASACSTPDPASLPLSSSLDHPTSVLLAAAIERLYDLNVGITPVQEGGPHKPLLLPQDPALHPDAAGLKCPEEK